MIYILIRHEQPKRHAGLKMFQDAGLACWNANRQRFAIRCLEFYYVRAIAFGP